MSIDVQMIRNSFQLAKPIAKEIAERFYQNLFRDYPESVPMFREVNMERQRAALIQSLVTAVDNLDNSAQLGQFLQGLGQRHVRYGVQDFHYEWVGTTLLKTFAQFFGDAWTTELRDQWAEVYAVMARTMIEASRSVSREAAKQSPGQPTQNNPSPKAVEAACDAEMILSQDLYQMIRGAARQTVKQIIQKELRRCVEDEISELLDEVNRSDLRKAG